MRIGFIGLGNMGAGMAANLVRAGHEVAVHNRTMAKAEPLVALGAKSAPTIAEACRGDAVITMLADDRALEAAAFGDSGIVANLSPGALHISCSTISVALAERLTAAHGRAGQRFVSAPVFGRPDAAAAAKLVVAAAGSDDTLASAKPVFDAIGQATFTFGATPSAANLVKLATNFLIANVIESLGEAVALTAKGGVDRHAYINLLTSTLFSAPVYRTYGALIADRTFEPAGFAAELGLKDIRLALAAGEALNVPLPIASLLRDRFLALLAQGGGALDWSAISSLAARDSGQG
jgi:3-hydroxyisobutyrate dehydrogenase-like beta-hydroxyacid dehydrogenase